MYKIEAFPIAPVSANINSFSIKREWMNEHLGHAAYNCFPLTIANKLGFSISFPKDIVFEWNGETNKSKSKIKFYSGEEFCYIDRGLGTIAFDTKTIFKTKEGVSTLIMSAPNYFIDGIQCLTSILSTSFFSGSTHIVHKIMKKNSIVEIKSNTPVATIIPISISQFENSELILHEFLSAEEKIFTPHSTEEYSIALKKYGEDNKKTANWYKNAIDHKGNKIGKHEIEDFKFNVKKVNYV